ncbi:2,3-bisphosphoglycerate-independent phosphoglycerate mutase [Thermosulfidibacter takaii ABI70S6]|uniref:2,3-bisphosphoglycerate-independent phosphoglycerate mutase n=1 Tax=Thermosulfidibacter takaii (strain DSM 17441 / JCM 13301 / NBRC 103674 / ABI70S6) TaxID=1298851 RepID=A0A0S3QSV0_THET7|nr:hypothetical protein [Thermosulfidibacter takaii]BAT71372.1 2,3-bisphosphoglycerate-independent phosphoglycerate mutase [Thermosulfidibacter takaii ABI70S6]
MQKLFAVVLGGIADHAVDGLGRRTPLQVARTPNLDHLAMLGGCGLYHPTIVGEPVTPDFALYTLLGNLPEIYPGRAAFEALARGVQLEEGKIYYLVEPAFVDSGVLVEVKPFESEEEEKAFFDFLCRHIDGLVRLDRGLYLATSDTFVRCTHPGIVGGCVRDDLGFEAMARLPERWEGNSSRIDKGLQPVNRLLFHGCGRYSKPPQGSSLPLKLFFYTDSFFFYGLVRWMGCDGVLVESNGIKTWLTEAFSKGMKSIGDYDGVFIYTDYIHRANIQTRAWKRVEVIEEMDQAFNLILESMVTEDVLIMVTSDITVPSVGYRPCSGLPVPVLIMGEGVRRGVSTKFDEAFAASGSLGVLRGKELLLTLFSYMGYFCSTV